MTKGELDLMRAMLREELEPVKEEQAAQGRRISDLEKAKRTHSGQIAAVKTQDIARLQSEAKLDRKGDNEAIGVAFDRMAIFVNDIAENVSTIKEQLQPRSIVELPDGRGGTSVRPASVVAAESSVRTENKQEGIAKVVLDTALDATKAVTNSASVQKWQKRITTPLLVATPVLVELVHQVWPYIFPHAAP